MYPTTLREFEEAVPAVQRALQAAALSVDDFRPPPAARLLARFTEYLAEWERLDALHARVPPIPFLDDMLHLRITAKKGRLTRDYERFLETLRQETARNANQP